MGNIKIGMSETILMCLPIKKYRYANKRTITTANTIKPIKTLFNVDFRFCNSSKLNSENCFIR